MASAKSSVVEFEMKVNDTIVKKQFTIPAWGLGQVLREMRQQPEIVKINYYQKG